MDLNSSFGSHLEIEEYSPSKTNSHLNNSKFQNSELTWNIVFHFPNIFPLNSCIFSNSKTSTNQLAMSCQLFLM